MYAAHKLTSVSVQDILGALDQAEQQFSEGLSLIAQRGSVLDVRESVITLAVIKSFQTSMGRKDDKVQRLVARLLGMSSQFARLRLGPFC
jgi:separase